MLGKARQMAFYDFYIRSYAGNLYSYAVAPDLFRGLISVALALTLNWIPD